MQCPTNSSAKPSTILTNTTVSSWTSDTTYAGYSYRGDITHSGITSDTSATVVFGNTEASSGNYAPFAVTSTGKISVYSKVNTSITIPTIRIDATLNYFNLKGTVGNDTKPIKIVNGECVAVTDDLLPNKYTTIKSGTGYTVYQYGKLVFVRLEYAGPMNITDLPSSMGYYKAVLNGTNTGNVGQATIYGTTCNVTRQSTTEAMMGTLIYLTS